MVNAKLYNLDAKSTQTVTLADDIFNVSCSDNLLHQVIVSFQANQRKSYAHTKDRSEVRGGGIKPFRQKGTGRARAGSSRSPIWSGGGTTFGPRNTDNYSRKITKKMLKKALSVALSSKLKNNSLYIVDLSDTKDINTKKALNLIKNFLHKNKTLLILLNSTYKNLKFSLRNVQGIKIVMIENINLIDIVKFDNIIIPKSVTDDLEKNKGIKKDALLNNKKKNISKGKKEWSKF